MDGGKSLLSKEAFVIQSNGLDPKHVNLLARINVFLAIFYVPLWLKSSNGSEAAINDTVCLSFTAYWILRALML